MGLIFGGWGVCLRTTRLFLQAEWKRLTETLISNCAKIKQQENVGRDMCNIPASPAVHRGFSSPMIELRWAFGSLLLHCCAFCWRNCLICCCTCYTGDWKSCSENDNSTSYWTTQLQTLHRNFSTQLCAAMSLLLKWLKDHWWNWCPGISPTLPLFVYTNQSEVLYVK